MAGRTVLSDDEEEVEVEEDEEERAMEQDADDVADRDNDDEEDEEEGQDEYEQDGFIVDEVEEEEEEEEEEKQDSDEERHRKRRKKKRDSEKNYVLDEDDYELLQDNNITGFHRPQPGSKFKRLKKAGRDNDLEDRSGFSDEEDLDKNSHGSRTAEEKLKRSLFGDDEVVPLEDIAEEEEQPEEEEEDADIIGDDDEMADFIVDEEDVDETGAVLRKKKIKKKKPGQAPGVSSSALQEAHEIFGDVDELLMLRKQSLASSVGDSSWGEKKLEDEFEPFILSEKYMTPKDDSIRETDVPERIQLSEDITGPPPTDDKSIEEESTWIYSQLTNGGISPLFGYDQFLKEINKEEIGNVLTMIHVQKFDVPFISMYRKELCHSLLKDPDANVQESEGTPKLKFHKVLWAVQTLDKKWLLLQKRKNALQSYYNRRFEEEARRIDNESRLALNQQLFKSITEALRDAKSEREVDDIDAKFNLHFPPGEVDMEDGQFKKPKRKSLYSMCHKAGLWEVANKFGANSEQFGLLLSLEKISDELEDGKETPEEIAANFTCTLFETPQDVLKGARHMAAVEIGCEPNVRKHVRSIFMEKAVVSTSPTHEGNTTIDPYHQLAGVKWLRNKPLSEFSDAQWLLIQKGEAEKLIQVTIKLPDEIQKKLLSDASECYLSECVSTSAKLWNVQRKLILEDSFLTFILPIMEKEARSLLTARAKNWLLMEYGKQLWNKVSIAPFKRKDAENDLEDESESRVMACCWGPGKPATTIVMLDSAGEMVDVLYAGSISVRSQAAADQQRKKNDHHRVLKFMTDHHPHAVCVGAANMACRQLKDDIYEVIFKIVEDHPKDVSRDLENISIIFGDESLPRLYENSRVSSDQLPGQPGIVKRSVALGRYLQNPLAMVATLCGPGKEILSWKLCPLEHFLTPDEKYEVVEQVMIDATNQVGLDINLAASHEWLCAPLQFISGLGPRKASALQRAFVRAGSIFNRKEIPMKILRKKVFINGVGFLRVRRSGAAAASSHIMDLLDDTRIHPESYDLARNLAKDVYAEDAPDEPNDMDDDIQEMAIEHVRERPDMLRLLDINEYAKSIFDRYGTDKSETLYDIKMELLHGFQDLRKPFKDPSPEEEFAMLSGETDETISLGRIVQVTVRHVQESRIVCAFDSGLKGMIMSDDYSDEGFDPERIHEGDIITCKIKNVNKNRHVVYLTAKASDLRNRPFNIRNRDPYYHEDEISLQSDMEKARKKKELAKKHFKPRMIVHPCFRNVTADEAIEYLSDKEPGESIIRPSSKGPSFLTLTLKVFDGVHAHKEIVEGGKDHKDITSLLRLGKTLTIDKDTFEDLDEVMDRYVDPLVTHLKAMLSYRKFRKGTKTEVDDLLRTEKAANPMRIVYSFGISHEHPGTFILSYIRTSNPHHEYIGLYPNGFRFRKKDFDNIDRLVAYFQKNIDKLPPDSGPSIRTVAAMVPMKSPAWASSGGGSVASASAGSNDGWRGYNSDRERSTTPGSRTGDRFDSRSINSRDVHPSGVPRPGRGRGRPHGKGNNYGGIGHDSDYGTPKWSMNENDGLSTFPGAKVNNSPGKDPWGWGSGGSGRGNITGDSSSGGDWAGGHADRSKGGSREGSGAGGRGRGAWEVGNGAAPGWAGNVSGRGGWSGGSDFGGRTGEELANPNGSAAGFAASTGWSDSRR
ncbi:transcription elongation factor SPT6 homolog [Zingiber officinale]|uniref:transcription elongation factor SPT6 homolog n=1 Tax=Zingiber officinale TaxID=94328 RepID=UPI001C4BC1F5|nr:transcription elongation factor SPT6 homolog [Zingiber officinale]